jgi:HEAT repeat protein
VRAWLGRSSERPVRYKVAWALGEIGDDQAIGPLIEALRDKSSDVRVIAIHALEKLRAGDALPHLRALLNDHEKAHFGDQISVAEAAKAAIAGWKQSVDKTTRQRFNARVAT